MKPTSRQINNFIAKYILQNFVNSSVDTTKIINAVLQESRIFVMGGCERRDGQTGYLVLSTWGKEAKYHTFWFWRNGKVVETEGCCTEHCLTFAQYLKKFVFDEKYGKKVIQ